MSKFAKSADQMELPESKQVNFYRRDVITIFITTKRIIGRKKTHLGKSSELDSH